MLQKCKRHLRMTGKVMNCVEKQKRSSDMMLFLQLTPDTNVLSSHSHFRAGVKFRFLHVTT